MIIIVIDANILFSALIKNSVNAKLIFEEEIILYTPEFIVDEFLKYQEMILKKTSRSKDEFIQIMHMLKDIITIIPKEEYSKFMEEAENLSPDEKDVLYFALALKLKCGIWSNDKKLKTQDKVKIYSTEEIKNLLN
ncbi:PIN domain-containing protein [Candidatus Woesearchaeota archaeon]|nr:PIN domain-containing protein [Candidatus Woesearchaeota archaeon]